MEGVDLFMKDNLMLIGEIAEFFGVSRKAIRLYEKKGIIKPVKVDADNGYRYYSAEQVQQLNGLLELKALGFSLDEIKTIMDGKISKEQLLAALMEKRRAWQETMEKAKYRMECLDSVAAHIKDSGTAERFEDLTEEERAWLLVKMVCVEDISVRNALSEALWL